MLFYLKKPIILLDSKKYNYFLRSQIKTNQKLLNSLIVDISKSNYVIGKNYKVDIKKYNNYKDSFIKKKNSPEMSIWTIFHDYFSNVDNKTLYHK